VSELKRNKTREERKIERLAALELRELTRGWRDGRGWQVKGSAGMPTWQFIEGGKFQPITPNE